MDVLEGTLQVLQHTSCRRITGGIKYTGQDYTEINQARRLKELFPVDGIDLLPFTL